MELYWLAAPALGVRVWKIIWTSRGEWIAAARAHWFPVTGIG